jgi:hypothetical protein
MDEMSMSIIRGVTDIAELELTNQISRRIQKLYSEGIPIRLRICCLHVTDEKKDLMVSPFVYKLPLYFLLDSF